MEADDASRQREFGSEDRVERDLADEPVYIVDDDRMVRRALSFALETSGFEVRAFASGREFLDEVDLLASGCVVLDMRMPGMDGIAVLDALGDRIKRFPVVMTSGHGDRDIAVKAMKRGASDFLEKPFSDVALAEILTRLRNAGQPRAR